MSAAAIFRQLCADGSVVKGELSESTVNRFLARLKELNEHIRNLDNEIDNFMKPEEKAACEKIPRLSDIGKTGAQAIISVIGVDMSRFPSAGHIASWAGLCPGSNESAGKRRSGKIRKGNALLRATLITCAHAAVKCKSSYFYAQFQRISAQGKETSHCRCCAFHADCHLLHASRP